jgi:protein-L-isoaspartate(D-aspartate) O-methyltransferase
MFWKSNNSDPYAARRERMIDEQIRRRGIRDPRVLDAMMRVPREQFLRESLRDSAYEDRALPIDCGQTISQPFIVAYMTEQLSLTPECTVLEVGTGTGYQTAILALLANQVYTIERFSALKEQAAACLSSLGLVNVTLSVADGSIGLAVHAPYDRVIVTAAAPKVPTPLTDQLTEGGILVLPVGGASEQTIYRVNRSAGGVTEVPMLGCRFVKLVGQQGWPSE